MRAAALRPSDGAPHYYTGLCYYSMNQYYRAADAYALALALDPSMREARDAAEWLALYMRGKVPAEDLGPRKRAESKATLRGAGAVAPERVSGVARPRR